MATTAAWGEQAQAHAAKGKPLFIQQRFNTKHPACVPPLPPMCLGIDAGCHLLLNIGSYCMAVTRVTYLSTLGSVDLLAEGLKANGLGYFADSLDTRTKKGETINQKKWLGRDYQVFLHKFEDILRSFPVGNAQRIGRKDALMGLWGRLRAYMQCVSAGLKRPKAAAYKVTKEFEEAHAKWHRDTGAKVYTLRPKGKALQEWMQTKFPQHKNGGIYLIAASSIFPMHAEFYWEYLGLPPLVFNLQGTEHLNKVLKRTLVTKTSGKRGTDKERPKQDKGVQAMVPLRQQLFHFPRTIFSVKKPYTGRCSRCKQIGHQCNNHRCPEYPPIFRELVPVTVCPVITLQ